MAKKYGKSDLIGVAIFTGATVYIFKGTPIESILVALPVFAAIAGIWYVVLVLGERVGN